MILKVRNEFKSLVKIPVKYVNPLCDDPVENKIEMKRMLRLNDIDKHVSFMTEQKFGIKFRPDGTFNP